jgi:hypothetical protein
MIKMIYRAKSGNAFPDGRVIEEVEWLITLLPDTEISFSTENILLAVRVAIKQGRLPREAVELWFDAENGSPKRRLTIYPGGGISPWPDGFCDTTDNLIIALL